MLQSETEIFDLISSWNMFFSLDGLVQVEKEDTWRDMGFWDFKANPKWHTHSNNAIPANPSKNHFCQLGTNHLDIWDHLEQSFRA